MSNIDRSHDFDESGFDTCRKCGDGRSSPDHRCAYCAQVRDGGVDQRGLCLSNPDRMALTDEECGTIWNNSYACDGCPAAENIREVAIAAHIAVHVTFALRAAFRAGVERARKRDANMLRLIMESLPWSKDATEDERTLVEGNIRNCIAAIERQR